MVRHERPCASSYLPVSGSQSKSGLITASTSRLDSFVRKNIAFYFSESCPSSPWARQFVMDVIRYDFRHTRGCFDFLCALPLRDWSPNSIVTFTDALRYKMWRGRLFLKMHGHGESWCSGHVLMQHSRPRCYLKVTPIETNLRTNLKARSTIDKIPTGSVKKRKESCKVTNQQTANRKRGEQHGPHRIIHHVIV